VKHTVNIADLRVSPNPEDVLITYALGSCLGITVHDPVARVGGLLHLMLPSSAIDPTKAAQNPFMFADTGVPELFLRCYKAGAQRERIIVTAAGGSCTHGEEKDDYFQIGKRNFVMLRKLLWKNSILLKAHDVGGNISRTMSLDIETGVVTIKFNGTLRTL
jgi:chemotaxis protein CheD